MSKSLYERLFFAALRRLDPETAHDRTLEALRLAQANPAGRATLRTLAGHIPVQPVQVGALHFPNPLGLAAARRKRGTAAATPPLGKPMRLISAPSAGKRKTRGRGLPACGRGVNVPTST